METCSKSIRTVTSSSVCRVLHFSKGEFETSSDFLAEKANLNFLSKRIERIWRTDLWFHFCCSPEIRQLYPNKFIQLDESRIYVLNTLFNLPGTKIYGSVRCSVWFYQQHCIEAVRKEENMRKHCTRALLE